jgi:hypothetical protein
MSRIERFASAIQTALWQETASPAGLHTPEPATVGTVPLSAIPREPAVLPSDLPSNPGPRSSIYLPPHRQTSVTEERTRFQQFQYGPFHRLRSPTQTLALAAEQERASTILGRPPRGGLIPAVQAYAGPLPPGLEGIEFYTIARPSNNHPSNVVWYLGDQGVWEVRLSGDTFAMIVVWIVELRYR